MNERDIILMEVASAQPSSTGWYRVKCPFCVTNTGKADKKGSLAVSQKTGHYECWKCQEKGRVDLGFRSSFDTIVPERKKIIMKPPDGFFPLYEEPGLTSISLKPARQYLVRRLGKRAKRIAKMAGLGACVSGKQANRIIVPLLNPEQTEWVGWVGRDWTDTKKLRYVYPKGMERILLNQGILNVDKPVPTLVVEGSFDALPYWPNVVACLGKPNENHVNALKESQSPLVVCLDADAWKQGWALTQRLRMAGKEVGFVRLPAGEDPGSVDPQWLWEEAGKSLSDT